MKRYILEISDYIFGIVYKKGLTHSVPDALSRPFKDRISSVQDNKTQFLGLTRQVIKEKQIKNKRLSKVISYFEGDDVPTKIPGIGPWHVLNLGMRRV